MFGIGLCNDNCASKEVSESYSISVMCYLYVADISLQVITMGRILVPWSSNWPICTYGNLVSILIWPRGNGTDFFFCQIGGLISMNVP